MCGIAISSLGLHGNVACSRNRAGGIAVVLSFLCTHSAADGLNSLPADNHFTAISRFALTVSFVPSDNVTVFADPPVVIVKCTIWLNAPSTGHCNFLPPTSTVFIPRGACAWKLNWISASPDLATTAAKRILISRAVVPLALRIESTSGQSSGMSFAPPGGVPRHVKSSDWPERIVRVSCSLPHAFDAILTVYLIGPSSATSDNTLMAGVA